MVAQERWLFFRHIFERVLSVFGFHMRFITFHSDHLTTQNRHWYCCRVSVKPLLKPATQNCGLCMRRECRERFPRHRLQTKPLFSDPAMHHDTRVAHVPLCMSVSLIHGGGEDVPGIPGACATRNFKYLTRGLWWGRQQICYSLASGWHANPTFVPV